MADRRQIETMIKKKEQEIQELELKMKDARTYLQALQDVLKKFPKEPAGNVKPETVLRPGSMVAQAREAILKVDRPLHVDDILKERGRERNRENRTALGSSLSAYVRKGIIFTRVAPNTFGLVEFEQHVTDLPEPPADFGKDKEPEDLPDEIPF